MSYLITILRDVSAVSITTNLGTLSYLGYLCKLEKVHEKARETSVTSC